MRARMVAAVGLVVALVMACHVEGERRSHERVGANGETLRAAFNADVAKVRVLALVSPT